MTLPEFLRTQIMLALTAVVLALIAGGASLFLLPVVLSVLLTRRLLRVHVPALDRLTLAWIWGCMVVIGVGLHRVGAWWPDALVAGVAMGVIMTRLHLSFVRERAGQPPVTLP